jgi:hypothetical protein
MGKEQSSRRRTAASGERSARMRRLPKRRGEIAEAAFLHKVAAMGFGVAKPWGDSERYDFIVDVRGRLVKVQVKSSHYARRGHEYTVNLHGWARRAYTAKEVDLVVVYLVPVDLWYVFPPRVFRGRTAVSLFPGSESKFEKYREGWEEFENARSLRSARVRSLRSG